MDDQAPRTLRRVLADIDGLMPSEDLLHAVLPLMAEVAALHAAGRVARLGLDDVANRGDGGLALVRPEGSPPRFNEAGLRALQPHVTSALRIVGEYRVTVETGVDAQVSDLRTEDGREGGDGAPAYLNGYRCWEQEIGHHDEVTDIFLVGLILASLACGLDFERPDDVSRFAEHHADLFRLNPSLHPVIAALIAEATALSRFDRTSSLAAMTERLADYRDQPTPLDIDRVLADAGGIPDRQEAVLTHLRDRLFDLSKRNRLIHFRQTQASVNLTVASVPLVMRVESIRPEQLATWGGRFAADVLAGPVTLSKWLRFEDQPYLPSAFDRIIQDTRRDRAEYGFSHLRLVVAFLRWRNLKDEPDKPILSPLLWLPAEITRKKGVSDQYSIHCADAPAEFNPALRHYLRELYGILLPETIDLAKTSIEAIQADLAAQIHQTEPGVQLAITDRPEIRLIHEKAVQRLRHFRRRDIRAPAQGTARPEYSYAADDYRPLGLALFEAYVRPSPLPQRIAVGAPLPPRAERMLGEGDAQATAYALAGGAGNRFDWEIDLTQVTLANFNYKKMSLVRDYNQLIQEGPAAPSFDRVFSIEPRDLDVAPPPPLAHDEQWGVVPADATQEAAAALARTGESFIIQGPPGTGKSQTITNLIADFVARGKRVLFVCEKRAALDVVFSRLRSAGLDGLACLIHDSQEDKKAFILDLKQGYEAWSQAEDGLDARRAQRDRAAQALGRHLDAIEHFEAAMARVDDAAGASLRTLIRRLVALPTPPEIGPAVRERLPGPAAWDPHRALARRTERIMRERFGADSLAAHPFARLSAASVAAERSYAEVEGFIVDSERLLDSLDPAFEDPAGILSPDMTLAEARLLAEAARRGLETNLAGHLDLLDRGSEASAALKAGLAVVAARGKALAAAAKAAARWTDPLSVADTTAALDQARRQERSVFRFLSGSWRRLKRTVEARYAFSGHAVAPKIVAVLEWLAAQQAAAAAQDAAKAELAARFGSPDLDALVAERQAWSTSRSPALKALIAKARGAADPADAIRREAQATARVLALADLCGRHLDGADGLTLDTLAEAIRDLREGLDDLPDLLPFLRAVDQAGPGVAFAMRTLAADVDAIEAAIVDEAVARLLRGHPDLTRFDAAQLGQHARGASRARGLLLDANAAVIRAGAHRRFRDNVRQSLLSVTQLDADGRTLKKVYSAGRRELEHEFGKSMRYRSIRDLADAETGVVVGDLKPVWLMSPLSVSDTLPLTAHRFDVVLFDEASQIPMEEAAPALCRAPQVIVVGDEMQLPPTSFFASARDEDAMQVTANEAGEAMSILLDAESLLNQAARTLPATLLAWHYRSRSEALISFSNAAFYDGRLVTVPDREVTATGEAPEALASSHPAAASTAVERLLARAISVHTVADGVYETRANPAEARLIAAMVRDLLARQTGLSIGIVAFSEAQQSEIEAALDALSASDPAFGAQLEREYVREDEGQINALFVKNLENVQGDERDIIILSICYAPDRSGRMAMNFGPINQRGGEKRLNVIFSRARRHMAVVSTIRPEAITNTHNDGARALRTFLSFAEAQARGDGARSQAILATLNPEAQRVFSRPAPVDALRDAIAQRLTARGHVVRVDVGSASFRCDLAVMDPSGSRFALAILLDGGGGAALYDRYIFQPDILRQFGWRVIDQPSHLWLRDPDKVIAQIEAALRSGDDEPFDDDPFEDSLSPAPEPVFRAPPAAEAPIEAAPPAERYTALRCRQGPSDKVWKVAVSGREMTVVFGRFGAKGSTVVKTFDSPERAEREARKLILEKLRKGYVEQDGQDDVRPA